MQLGAKQEPAAHRKHSTEPAASNERCEAAAMYEPTSCAAVVRMEAFCRDSLLLEERSSVKRIAMWLDPTYMNDDISALRYQQKWNADELQRRDRRRREYEFRQWEAALAVEAERNRLASQEQLRIVERRRKLRDARSQIEEDEATDRATIIEIEERLFNRRIVLAWGWGVVRFTAAHEEPFWRRLIEEEESREFMLLQA